LFAEVGASFDANIPTPLKVPIFFHLPAISMHSNQYFTSGIATQPGPADLITSGIPVDLDPSVAEALEVQELLVKKFGLVQTPQWSTVLTVWWLVSRD
jgi:hypothetical protein